MNHSIVNLENDRSIDTMIPSGAAPEKTVSHRPQGAQSKLKSLFVIPYIMGTMLLVGIAAYQYTQGANVFWLVTFLGALAPTLFFSAVMARGLLLKGHQARTAPHIIPISVFTGLAAVATIVGAAGFDGSIGAAIAAAGVYIGWMLYDYWYSSFGRRVTDVLVKGKALPRFSLTTLDGNRIESTNLPAGKKLFIFFRGNWCPLCMAQIREVASAYKELETRGVHTFLISPQSEKQSRHLAEQFDVNLHFLTDPDLSAAQALGIAHQGGLPTGMQTMGYQSDTVLPTVILTDTDGTIIYSDLTENYRIRPEPAEFLSELDAFEAQKQH